MSISIPNLLLLILILTTVLTFILFSIHHDDHNTNDKLQAKSQKKRLSRNYKTQSNNHNNNNHNHNHNHNISNTMSTSSISSSGKIKTKRVSIYGVSNSKKVSKVYKDIPIYMDWFLSSDAFTYINYKSLESVLSSYFNSPIKVIHVGPMSADYYKVGDLLSKHFCMKYQKMGYNNLVVDVQGYNKRIEVPFAQSYYDETIEICCKVFKSSDISNKKDVPFHLIVYLRFLNLYEQAGMFTDFTWFHRTDSASYFSNVQNGFMIAPSCDNISLRCYTSMIMIFQDNVIPKCMLKKYDKDEDFLICIKSDIATGGTNCINNALTDCFKTNLITNELLFNYIVMNDQQKSQKIWTTSIANDRRFNGYKALWLGKKSLNGKWLLPAESSTLSSLIASDINLTRHDEIKFIQSQKSKGLDCQIQKPTCSTYNMSKLPKLVQYSNSSLVQASISCTIHFAIAGFMKSGSTFLYNTIAQHPQIVKLLRGVGFKESGCYLPESMYGLKSVDRLNCFPFIEKHDNFYYGDGTVYYAIRKETPNYLINDNPDIKAIFVIRDPITRSLSHQRFSYLALKSKGLAKMKDIVDMALNVSRNGLYDLYPLAKHATEVPVGDERNKRIEALLARYQQGLSKHDAIYRRAANVFIHSLYFMPIYYWTKILKKGNVLVVAAEELDPKKMDPRFKKRTEMVLNPVVETDMHDAFKSLKNKTFVSNINRIFKFLNICPLNKVSIVDAHDTKENVPKGDGLDEVTRLRMVEFYKPFNQLLYDFLGEEFGYNY